MSFGGLVNDGNTYTVSAGKSPFSPVLSHRPTHQPELMTVSPELSSSKIIRSPFRNERNDEPSP